LEFRPVFLALRDLLSAFAGVFAAVICSNGPLASVYDAVISSSPGLYVDERKDVEVVASLRITSCDLPSSGAQVGHQESLSSPLMYDNRCRMQTGRVRRRINQYCVLFTFLKAV